MSTLEIRKQTAHMGMLIIRPVSKTLAKDLIIRNHYSHKWYTPFGLYNFGIFKETAPDEKGTTPGVEKIKPDHLVGRLTTVLKGLAEKYPHQQ